MAVSGTMFANDAATLTADGAPSPEAAPSAREAAGVAQEEPIAPPSTEPAPSSASMSAALAQAKHAALDMGSKAKAMTMKAGSQAKSVAKRAANNEKLAQNGMMISMGATVLTSIRGLKLRFLHPYAGAALVGFALLHMLQHQKKKKPFLPVLRDSAPH